MLNNTNAHLMGTRKRPHKLNLDTRFFENLARDPKAIDAGRHAAIDSDLKKDLFDLVLGNAVI